MTTTTYSARLAAGLRAFGFMEDRSDRSKYRAFTKSGTNGVNKKFVGCNGALRSGDCASRSYSMGDPANQTPVYLRVLEAGDKVMAAREATEVQVGS